jgi:hypothetical protein
MKPNTFFPSAFSLVASILVLVGGSAGGEPVQGLVYHPEGDAIVIKNGTRWDNRPMYCHERMAIVTGGEMPALNGRMGVLYVGIERGATRLPLHQFSERVMRYRPGRIEWELSDPRLPGLKATLIGTTLADATGFTARLAVEGAKSGDNALWAFFPPNPDKGETFRLKTGRNGYELDHEPAAAFSHIVGRLSAPVAKWELLDYGKREDFSSATAHQDGPVRGAGWLATLPLTKVAQSIAVGIDDNEGSYLTNLKKALDPAAVEDAARAFDQGLARVKNLGESVVVDTPDPYLNAAAGASVAASNGLFVHKCFVHGGSMWRFQMPGWRTMGGAISYGWTDQVRRAVELFDGLQIKKDDTKTKAEFSANGCQQWGNSRFFGEGFVHYKQPALHYEFQTLMFDDAVRAWRSTADPVLEKHLLPMLELHLKRARECFDADDDGLYESYNNTWPNDSIWFNGGGTPEQSAYMYNSHRAAADMCRRAGDRAGAARHDAQAKKIHTALDKILWLPEAGHYGSFLEPGGNRRVNPNAWVYAQHVPIEAGMTTPEQAWKAMFYTEWGMERIKLPFGGEMRHTSNFVPGQWSIRELYHGDNFAIALGYFLGGEGNDGWEILRGTMLQAMYGDLEPKKGFSNESGTFNRVNIISPGGLSQPNCGIDFNDISSSFARTLVEGLFGYRPDYPNKVVRIEPSFPSTWDRAFMKTPAFALQLKDHTYKLKLTQPAAVKFGLPIRAKKVRSVLVNGKPAKFTIEPWAGYGMLRLEVPSTTLVEVKLDLEGESPDLAIKSEDKSEGTPGHHLVLDQIDGDVPRYQITKLHVTEAPEPALLREAPADATWKPIDISAQLNGDIRTIFQQRYDSPRPETCSMRIGFDSWSAWTFPHWGIHTPSVGMENALSTDSPAYEATDPAIANPIKALTVEAWVTPGSMPADGGRILDRTIPDTSDGFLLDTYPGNSLRLITSNGAVTAPNALAPGKAVHVAGVYDSAARVMKLYLNGKEVASRTDGSFPPIKPVASPLRIGLGGPETKPFIGEIRRAAVHDRALTAAEIAARVNADAPSAGPADWKLDATLEGLKRIDDSMKPKADLIQGGHLVTPQHARFLKPQPEKNIAFTSLWDNWPDAVTVPVDAKGDSVWLLVTGTTNPMQCKISNAVIKFRYQDGVEEKLDLVPPRNFWSMCGFGRVDYNYEREAFALPKTPPAHVNLGTNCRAMVYGWKLRPGIALKDISLETLSQDVVIGLMGVSVMNPQP